MLLRADIPAGCMASNCTRSPCLWRPCQCSRYQFFPWEESCFSSLVCSPFQTLDRRSQCKWTLEAAVVFYLFKEWTYRSKEIARLMSRLPTWFSAPLSKQSTYGMNSGFCSSCESQLFVNSLLSFLSPDAKEFWIWYMPIKHDSLKLQLLIQLA